ncbi:MAG: erythromycin esterase family protein, partial [Deltaproteobacteria bacterium]|nr:erythromycin esterase family protein [Kofleriaceae bacterium]
IDVPADAAQLVLGPLLVGGGTAWFDDLRLEVVDVPPAKPITLAGVVVDPAGKPAVGAIVTLMDASGNVHAFVTTDASGRFELAARTGAWGMSAHHPSGAGVFFDPRELADDTRDLRFAIGEGGVLVRGRVTAANPLPADSRVEVAPYSNHQTDIFVVPVGADGRFEARLPRGEEYGATLRGKAVVGSAAGKRTGDEVAIEVKATVLGPPPAEVNAWVAKHAVPLASAEAGNGFADLKPIGKMIGKARIVALGEATHGTREFFQLKHRFLEYLVAEHGFDAFVIEANLPECRAINDYVLHGKGDPRKALDGIYFWTWNTEEVLALVEWMRAWNADPRHTKKIQFFGDDMQTASVAYANVVAFLKRVVPSEADTLAAPLAVFGTDAASQTFAARPAAEAKATLDAIATLAARFDRERAAWSKLAGKDAYLDAREDVRVIGQAAALFRAGAKSFEARDVAMADNVDHILARLGKRSRVVLWAHNGHVSNGLGAMKNQGAHLRERHGKGYVIFGFVFGEGSFQARDWTKGQGSAVTEHTLGPPPETDVSAPFRATGKPIVVVDLRKAPRGVVADWFAAPHPMRDTGAVFTNEANMSSPQEVSKRYDAIIYVDKTTRARPNAGGIRK